MKAYKLELLVIDFENMGEEEIRDCIEHTKYVNPTVIRMVEKEIGEWSDEHPLNKIDKMVGEFDKTFNN